MTMTAVDRLLGRSPAKARPVAEAPNEISVADRAYPKPKRSFFDRRGTGGQIIGTIGDALLIGAGRDPIHTPRVRQLQLGDAMIDYTTDPERAIERASQIDPEFAAELSEQHSQEQLRAAQMRQAQDEHDNTTHERALAFLGSATDNTFPRVKELIRRLYSERGTEPLFNIDEIETLDDAIAMARGGISPKDQASLAESERYHRATENVQRQAEFGRNYREVFGEVSANQRANQAERGRETRNVRDNTTRRETSRGPVARPNIRFGKRADGTRYVIN